MIYTVKQGDNLYDISRRFDIPLGILEADNGMTDSESLVVGEDLVVLPPAVTYTAVEGDTVYSVAEKYGIGANGIWRENPSLEGSPTLYPGQTLVISRRDRRKLGDMALGGFAYPYIEDSALRASLPYLTYLSVFANGLTASGELIPPDGEERLVDTANEYGTVPLLMVTSLTEEGTFSNILVRDILTSEEISSNVIANTVAAVEEKGYGGVDVDFEYIGDLAPQYVEFLSRLKSALGDRPLFVSLAPKTSGDMPGILYSGHDYGAIGDVADYALLMTYEWGYTYGPPMAVSPLDKVREVVEYGVSEIDSGKILLGIPNYGYDFTLPYVRGESAATSISNSDAVSLAREVGAEIKYDEISQAPYFEYYDGGRRHIVWFESARSVEAMGSLVAEKSLFGASIWNVMKFFPQMYLQLSSMFDIL